MWSFLLHVGSDKKLCLSLKIHKHLHVDYNPLKGMLVIKLLFYISDSVCYCLGLIDKVCLKNKCKCGHFYCMWDLIRNYAYLWSDKVVKKGHILSLFAHCARRIRDQRDSAMVMKMIEFVHDHGPRWIIFYCMWDLIRNYAYLWSDKVVKKGHILSLISSAVLSY
jgi:hypothetical protein